LDLVSTPLDRINSSLFQNVLINIKSYYSYWARPVFLLLGLAKQPMPLWPIVAMPPRSRCQPPYVPATRLWHPALQAPLTRVPALRARQHEPHAPCSTSPPPPPLPPQMHAELALSLILFPCFGNETPSATPPPSPTTSTFSHKTNCRSSKCLPSPEFDQDHAAVTTLLNEHRCCVSSFKIYPQVTLPLPHQYCRVFHKSPLATMRPTPPTRPHHPKHFYPCPRGHTSSMSPHPHHHAYTPPLDILMLTLLTPPPGRHYRFLAARATALAEAMVTVCMSCAVGRAGLAVWVVGQARRLGSAEVRPAWRGHWARFGHSTEIPFPLSILYLNSRKNHPNFQKSCKFG
jgi:hypothetical protein